MANVAVNFKHFRMNDCRPPLSLEEVFRLFGSWSDIHTFVFDKMLNQASVSITGNVSNQWSGSTISIANLPSSFEVRYHKTAYQQAMSFTITGNTYYIGTDVSGYPFAQQGSTLLEKVPRVTPQVADVVVVFRQQQFENDASSGTSPTATNYVWYSVSLYMNNSLQYCFILPALATTTVTEIGFSAYNTDVVNYTNVVVPDLPETAEYGTLDQGEIPYSGLQRTIDGRYLRMFIRFDGSLRAFRTKAVVSVQSLLDEEFYATSITKNMTDLVTHVRMVGAYIWAEYADTSLIEQYGHRFQELNNPMLITDGECETEAQRSIVRTEETVFQEKGNMPFLPLLEPEDRITTPDGTWLLTDIQYSMEDSGAATATVTLRRYGWGEP